jgi:hypothetical protein
LNAKNEPNVEVRLGAIYALERIAYDSPRDHWPIIEVLTAYVRQNAPAPAQDELGAEEECEEPKKKIAKARYRDSGHSYCSRKTQTRPLA